MAQIIEVVPGRETGSGAGRVMTMSTIAFTLLFAVWLMFGILGVPIQKELDLSDVQLSWLSAFAVLNGALWRLPARILTDRIGGRTLTVAMLFGCAIPTYFLAKAHSCGLLRLLACFVGFAGNLFSVGTPWNAAWFARDRQGLALGVFGAGNVGACGTRVRGPRMI